MIIRYVMQNETPLSLRSGREKNREDTLKYIPGSTLLGGLATIHTSLCANKRDELAHFFMQNKINFSNLYPASFEQDDLTMADDSPIRPIPNTAFTCKVYRGFAHRSDKDDPKHGVRDHLIPWATYALSQQQDCSALIAVRNCPCRQRNPIPMEQFSGFYRQHDQSIAASQSKTELRTRTGINRWTGSTAQGILYSREAIQTGYKFWGTIQFLDTSIQDDFEQFLKSASAKGLLRFGNNRSRGMGKLHLESSTIQSYAPDSAETIAQRAQKFDAKLRESANQHATAAFYLPITLQSDAILFDRLFRSRLQLTPAICGFPMGKLVYQHAGKKRVMGWNGLWGLPKADTWAITKGSVFLFELDSEPDFEALAALQVNGVGARRTEGFGQLTVADPFHLETNLR
ncbi:MAG: RAMP superfamily CRISPR-associated protein [Candidatus Promineifilaceae bacterium]